MVYNESLVSIFTIIFINTYNFGKITMNGVRKILIPETIRQTHQLKFEPKNIVDKTVTNRAEVALVLI